MEWNTWVFNKSNSYCPSYHSALQRTTKTSNLHHSNVDPARHTSSSSQLSHDMQLSIYNEKHFSTTFSIDPTSQCSVFDRAFGSCLPPASQRIGKFYNSAWVLKQFATCVLRTLSRCLIYTVLNRVLKVHAKLHIHSRWWPNVKI